jgi:hypothetical protein
MACVTLQQQVLGISLVADFTAQYIIAVSVLGVACNLSMGDWSYFLGLVSQLLPQLNLPRLHDIGLPLYKVLFLGPLVQCPFGMAFLLSL